MRMTSLYRGTVILPRIGFFGLKLGIVGIVLLILSELNFVHQQKALSEGLASVIEVPITTTTEIDPNNEGKLIHVTGMIKINSNNVSDVDFGSNLLNNTKKMRLYRNVEMYQWIEKEHHQEKKNTGGSTTKTYTYTYEKQWSNTLIDSERFHDSSYQNPSSMKYISKESITRNKMKIIIITNLTLGPFSLSNSPDIMNKITTNETLDEYDLMLHLQYNPYMYQIQKIPHGYYIGEAVNRPQIGDSRITYQEIQLPSQIISIIGKQTDGTLTTYIANKNTGSFLLIEPGIHDSAEMFLHANQKLERVTWLLRLIGFLLIFFMLEVLKGAGINLADIPCTGNCLTRTTSTIHGLVALLSSLTTIAVVWLACHLIASFCLLCVAAIMTYFIYKIQNKKTSKNYETVWCNDIKSNLQPEAYGVNFELPVVVTDAVTIPAEPETSGVSFDLSVVVADSVTMPVDQHHELPEYLPSSINGYNEIMAKPKALRADDYSI